MASWGLLQGLGQGLNQVGSTMMADKLEQMKQERLQKFQAEQAKIDRTFRAEQADVDRGIQEEQFGKSHGLDVERTGASVRAADASVAAAEFGMENTTEDRANAVRRTEVVKEGGRTFLVNYNAAGEEVLRVEDSENHQLATAHQVFKSLQSMIDDGTPLTPSQQQAYDRTVEVMMSSLGAGKEEEAPEVGKDVLAALGLDRDNLPDPTPTPNPTPARNARSELDDYTIQRPPGLLNRAADALFSAASPPADKILHDLEEYITDSKIDSDFSEGTDASRRLFASKLIAIRDDPKASPEAVAKAKELLDRIKPR